MDWITKKEDLFFFAAGFIIFMDIVWPVGRFIQRKLAFQAAKRFYGPQPANKTELEEKLNLFWSSERKKHIKGDVLLSHDRIAGTVKRNWQRIWETVSYIAGENWIKDQTGLTKKPRKYPWTLAVLVVVVCKPFGLIGAGIVSLFSGNPFEHNLKRFPNELASLRRFYANGIEHAAPKAPAPKLPPGSLEGQAALLSRVGIPIGYQDPLDPLNPTPLHYNGDRHLVTFGPIGTGKNTTSQTPALLEDDASALVIDVKGQLCAITAKRRVQMGHKVLVLNPFDVLGIPSATYNPLTHLDENSLTFASDCQRIAEGLVDQKKADHWELSALDVVGLLIQWVKLFEEDKSLVRVRQLLNLPEDLRIAHFEKMMTCGNAAIAEGAARYTSDSKEVRDSIQTAVIQLGFLRDQTIAKVLQGGPHEISFADLKRSKMTVFIIIPPELLHTHGKFLRLLALSALGELIREKTAPPKRVLFMLDEFAQLGAMSIIENAASIVRDYKIRLWIILQNLPQLKALYDKKWESFLSSAGVVQVFTPNDLETAEYFSKRSGIKTKMRKSESSGTSQSTQGVSSSESTSYQETEEPVFRKEELWEMPESSHLLLCAGLPRSIMARRFRYFENSLYQRQYEKDPYHMSTEERAEFERKARAGEWVVNYDMQEDDGVLDLDDPV